MCSTVQEQITTCGQNAIVKIGERTNIRPQQIEIFENVKIQNATCNTVGTEIVGWFCCFTSQVNCYGHCGTVSSPNHTFSWAGLNKRLTSNLCTYFRL